MEFITQNGNKKVEIKPASFREANDLKKIILKSLGNNADKIKINGDVNLLEILPKILIELETSAEFESAVNKCLIHCIYDSFYKIDEQLFDAHPEAREDYYEILTTCVEVNIRPLWKSLISELKKRIQGIPTENPVQ